MAYSSSGGAMKYVVGAMLGAALVVALGAAVVGGIALGRWSARREAVAPVTVGPVAVAPEVGGGKVAVAAGGAGTAAPDLTGQVASLEASSQQANAAAGSPMAVVGNPPEAPVGPPPSYDFRNTLAAGQNPPQVQVQPQVPASYPPGVVDVNVLATELQPIGEWVEIPEYHHCWKPRRVPAGWRPYTVGHWVYTEYGLTWVSDEPWGLICYHYGSWIEISPGVWVWVPGRVWAPAWVAWRSGGDCIGWAPLPPALCTGQRAVVEADVEMIPAGAFCFVSASFVLDDHVERRVRPRTENVTIAMQTVNVTNIRVTNDVVVNASLNVEAVERATKKKVETVSLQMADNPAEAAKAKSEGHAVIYAPGAAIPGKGPGVTVAPVKPNVSVMKDQAGELARQRQEALDQAKAADLLKQQQAEAAEAAKRQKDAVDEAAKQKAAAEAAAEKVKEDAWEKMKTAELMKEQQEKGAADKAAVEKAAEDKTKLDALEKAKEAELARQAADKAKSDAVGKANLVEEGKPVDAAASAASARQQAAAAAAAAENARVAQEAADRARRANENSGSTTQPASGRGGR